MKKISILLIVLMMVGVGFLSGCIDVPEITDDLTKKMTIVTFTVTPSIINLGDTANLSWVVTGSDTIINIDNGIGDVGLTGSRIISPIKTTIYKLTATNSTSTKEVTTQIIVITKNPEENNSENRIAVIDTTTGIIKVQLYEDKMPITTANFVKLANNGFYNGLVFHRVIDNFVIQTGGFLPDGTQVTSPYDNIQFETSNVKHVDGAISMASTGSKVGGGAQFFICDGAQSGLDGKYAAFGIVIEGMDIVREISSVQTTTKFGSNSDWPVNDIIINSITIVSS